jgi:hypothetical protein
MDGNQKVSAAEAQGPEHTYNWTCFLVPAGGVPVDDGPECQACRLQVTREALARIRATL